MTIDEIIAEIQHDMSDVFSISDKKEAKVKRLVQKNTIYPYRVHSYVTSKKKNRWILMWEFLSKKMVGDGALFAFACIVNSEVGKYVIMPSCINGQTIMIFFTPHFFQRFAQRKGIELTGDDLIRRFLQYNPNFSIDTKMKYVSGTKRAITATATSSEGVALGYVIPEKFSFLFKTFISYDMSKGEQVVCFEELEGQRKEHYFNFLEQFK